MLVSLKISSLFCSSTGIAGLLPTLRYFMLHTLRFSLYTLYYFVVDAQ